MKTMIKKFARWANWIDYRGRLICHEIITDIVVLAIIIVDIYIGLVLKRRIDYAQSC